MFLFINIRSTCLRMTSSWYRLCGFVVIEYQFVSRACIEFDVKWLSKQQSFYRERYARSMNFRHCYLPQVWGIGEGAAKTNPVKFYVRITFWFCRLWRFVYGWMYNCHILSPTLGQLCRQSQRNTSDAGGALNFFSGRGVQPGFPKCEACELIFTSEKGGLWTENFQIWGLVSSKFPNLGACELKFGWKLRLERLKFPNFLKRGSCELTLLLEMGLLQTQYRRGVKRGSSGPHIPIPPF